MKNRLSAYAVGFIFLSGCAANTPSYKQITVIDDNQPKADISAESSRADDVTVLKQTPQEFEFIAVGTGVTTKYERPIEAEKRAEEDALNKVVKKSGVNVYSSFQDIMAQYGSTSYQFVGRYLNVWTTNLVEYERAAPASCNSKGESYNCLVKIKGKVHFKGDPDPNFELKAELGKPAYFEQDDVALKVRLSKDAYITVLDCDEDGNVSLIFPNRLAHDNFLPANKELNIPGDYMFQLKAMLPPGRAETGEILHVIATKTQPLVLLDTLKEEKNGGFISYSLGGVKDLVTKLSKFNRSDWTAKVIVYTVNKK